MASTEFNFIDWKHKEIRVPISRKIKFKKISFDSISSRWKKFKTEYYKNKLESKKEVQK